MKPTILAAAIALVLTCSVSAGDPDHPTSTGTTVADHPTSTGTTADHPSESRHTTSEHPQSAEREDELIQKKCPVTGNDINTEFYGDHDGKRVYFCSKKCIRKFRKDPAKCIEKVEETCGAVQTL